VRLENKILGLFVLTLTSALAAPPTLQEAEQFYRSQEWERARVAYDTIYASRRPESSLPASFYYNYGTILMRAGQPGAAYIHLRKAESLAPFNADIRHNRRLSAEQVSPTARASMPYTWLAWWPAELRFLPWQVWLCGFLLTTAPALWLTIWRPKSVWRPVLLALSIPLLLIGMLAGWQARQHVAGALQTSTLRSGPGTTFPEISKLEAGSLVNKEETRDGWVKVRYRRNLQDIVGWIELPTILEIL
jgi:hypothetical protein